MSARYTIVGTLASGGMGTVYLARMSGSAGFSRLVAVKRLHPELAAQREFIAMLVDEARMASQIRHVNVIDTLDLVATDGGFSLVLEYVEGAALSSLVKYSQKADEPITPAITLALIRGMLRGLDAAHEARGADGHPLGIVHRDVSPQNVLVGVDGIPRLIDFGIAKAMGRMVATRPGEVRGKFSYMAPEQLLDRPATRQADVYAAGVLLWELLTGERLFVAEDQRAVVAKVLAGEIKPPSTFNPAVSPELDAIVLKATARDLGERYLSARELIEAIAPFPVASDDEVGSWVRRVAAPFLAKKDALLQNVVPDHSRSVEDLMAELAQSGSAPAMSNTPQTPYALPSAQPPTPAPPPSLGPTRAQSAPEMMALGPYREDAVQATVGNVELTDLRPTPNPTPRWWLVLPISVAIGAIFGTVAVVVMRSSPKPVPTFSSLPTPPSSAAPSVLTDPAPIPTPMPTPADTETGTSLEVVDAPATTPKAHGKRTTKPAKPSPVPSARDAGAPASVPSDNGRGPR